MTTDISKTNIYINLILIKTLKFQSNFQKYKITPGKIGDTIRRPYIYWIDALQYFGFFYFEHEKAVSFVHQKKN